VKKSRRTEEKKNIDSPRSGASWLKSFERNFKAVKLFIEKKPFQLIIYTGGSMRFEEFIRIIEKDSMTIAQKWVKRVTESEFTGTYKNLSEEQLVRTARGVYENLGLFLNPKTPPEEIGKIYAKLGAERYEQGVPLCELAYAIHFDKKVLLNHIFAEGILPDTLKLYQTHDFLARLHDFFDLASYYLARGFQEALYKRILSQKGVDQDNIENIFPVGSFYYEKEPDFRTFEKAMEGFNLFKVK
jgi:hypothetical protein